MKERWPSLLHKKQWNFKRSGDSSWKLLVTYILPLFYCCIIYFFCYHDSAQTYFLMSQDGTMRHFWVSFHFLYWIKRTQWTLLLAAFYRVPESFCINAPKISELWHSIWISSSKRKSLSRICIQLCNFKQHLNFLLPDAEHKPLASKGILYLLPLLELCSKLQTDKMQELEFSKDHLNELLQVKEEMVMTIT